MSEYQYYEFQTIDRPLDKAAQTKLRALSSRAQITATSFTNSYQWGDFKGNPGGLMEEWFDLHLYLANWGSRRLMIRLPERMIDRRIVDACLKQSECAKVRVAGEHVILDIECQELDTEWDDGPGLLAEMAPLRADLLAGDLRLLYLVWLIGVEFDLVGDDTPEPLAGIGPLTDGLKAFAAFFCLDSDLLRAAAERDGVLDRGAMSPEAAREAIACLPDQDKIALLSKVFAGEPHVRIELRAALERRLKVEAEAPGATPRTAGELRARAEAIHVAREQQAARQAAEEHVRRAREEEARRREHLLAIARRGEGVWRDVEAEIGRSNASGYDRAAGLLLDLRAVAEERDGLPDFTRRIVDIRERHARKSRFIQRIVELA